MSPTAEKWFNESLNPTTWPTMIEHHTSALPPSLWAATAEPALDCPPLRGSTDTDVVIIGGGFTGLSAALHLGLAGRQAVVLEAHEPGWGASGRNGGQVNPGWKILPDEIIGRFGRDRGERIVDMASKTCDLVFDLVEQHNIKCDAVRPGYVQGANDASGIKAVQDWQRQWQARGVETSYLSRPEVSDLLGTEFYRGAMIDARGGNVQPFSYARGLARAAAQNGANIHGQSPVIGIEPDGRGWLVRTHGARTKCEKIVIGTNGYTTKAWPGLEKTVVPLASFIMATKPLGDNLRRSVLPGLHAVSETRRIGVYYRMDRDGRFVIGGRGNLFNAEPMGNSDHVAREAHRIFPALGDVPWDFHWGGYVAMTREHTPKLMGLAPGVFAGLGYNGRGIAMATMMGKQLALAATADEPDMLVTPLSPIAFHNFRQFGISAKLLSGQLLDRIV
jgi:glycine/D-amino acid oxidase-like deaminating enzyme